MTYHFVDFLIVAIKGHGLGSLNAITLQNLEWGVCIAGKERMGKKREGKIKGGMEGKVIWMIKGRPKRVSPSLVPRQGRGRIW